MPFATFTSQFFVAPAAAPCGDHVADSSPRPQCGQEGRSGRVRGNRRSSYRIVVHGLPFFCKKLPGLVGNALWDVRCHSRQDPLGLLALANNLRRCDLAYVWGGRITMGKFLRAARSLGKEKIVMFWCGSDVLEAQREVQNGKMDPWVARKIHWAASPTLASEVKSLGLDCEYVQASFVDQVVCPAPLSRKFSVLVFLPTAARKELYGWDRVIEVARALPFVEFNLVGLRDTNPLSAPPNVVVHHWIADMAPLYERTIVLWRPVRHDAGVSFMVLEALAHGRHVLYTYPFPASLHVTSVESAVKQLDRLVSLHRAGQLSLNHDGIRAVAERYSSEAVRSELRRRWEEIILS